MEQDRSTNVHVKLDKLTHTRFKSTLVEMDASMQEAFQWFAKCLAEGNRSAVRLVEQMKRERARAILAGTGLKPGLRGRRRALNELDQETLYDLINNPGDEDDDEDPLPAEG